MQISDYLKKIQKLSRLNTKNKTIISEILEEFFGKEISEMCKIEIKNKTIKIKAPSVVRSEILFQKQKILEAINKKLSDQTVFTELV